MSDTDKNASPAAGAKAQTTSHEARRFALRKRFVITGCVAVVLTLGVSIYLSQWVAKPKIDPSPLPWPDVDAPYIPTPQNVVEKMLELAEVQKDDLVYDLGCGDGRIVVTAAKRYGCRAVGFDNNSERVKESRESAKKNGVESLVTIQQRDIFTLDLGKADVVTLYLLPRLNIKLIPQLQKLKPGSRIVSHDFAMRGVKPEQVVDLTSDDDEAGHTVYLWRTPLKVANKATPN
jgi:SAM-dependent methyltransferase